MAYRERGGSEPVIRESKAMAGIHPGSSGGAMKQWRQGRDRWGGGGLV